MILLKGFKFWKRLVKFVLQLFKMKKKKMGKFSKEDGWIVSKQSYDSLVRSHQDRYGNTAEFTKHVTIGIDVLKKVLETDPTAVKAVFGFDGHQQTVIIVPVDEMGIELAVKAAAGGMKDDKTGGSGSTGPRCPVSC